MSPGAVLLAALTSQAPLSFADVRAGDFVTYQVREGRTVEVFACAADEKQVRVALQVRDEKARATGTVLDGVLVSVPRAPLAPAPRLADPAGVATEQAAGRSFPDCGTWKTLSTHGPNTTVVRCAARELILGGGLVRDEFHQFTIRGQASEGSKTLVAFGTREAPRCPDWPVASLGGWVRRWSTGPDGQLLEETRVTAGSAWLRFTTQPFRKQPGGPVKAAGATWGKAGKPTVRDAYLVDEALDWAAALPSSSLVAGKALALGPTSVAVREVTEQADERDATGEETRCWASVAALPDAPLSARAVPVARRWVRTSTWSDATVTKGETKLVGWGP
jgi:hypothetical protein